MNPEIDRAAEFAGLQVPIKARRQLEKLATWLRDEAIPAGGLGPAEGSVVESRHIADSMLFAAAWNSAPEECWDLGTGVGLPGLVLAIVWPSTRMVLIDRSGKRCDLARRASRVVGLEVTIEQAEISSLSGQIGAIVSRATIPASAIRMFLLRLLRPGGIAVVSGTRHVSSGFEQMSIPRGILDRPPRLLIMRAP